VVPLARRVREVRRPRQQDRRSPELERATAAAEPNGQAMAIRERKIAISLAIVAAIAAPFVTGTWKRQPKSSTWVPLTVEQRADDAAYLERTNNCQTLVDRTRELQRLGFNPPLGEEVMCDIRRERFNDGGTFQRLLSVPKYLGVNGIAVVVGFVSVFGLAIMLPVLIRRYWRWLNT
jgi:hypothetical protein